MFSLFTKHFLFFCILFNSLDSRPFVISEIKTDYEDEEFCELLSFLTDLYNPSVEDYLKIQNYLKYGRRPYLDVLFHHLIDVGFLNKDSDRSHFCHKRLLQEMVFVKGGDLPRLERRVLGGAAENDRSQCIVLYASFNDNKNPWFSKSYEDSVLLLVDELEEIGWKGHVLYYLGGYPLVSKGGIRFIHIPYSFKLLSFIEASSLGYEDILWLDSSMHPTNDLKNVFSKIHEEGYLFLFNGIHLDYDFNFTLPLLPVLSVKSSGVDISDLKYIPHVIAGIVGISFLHEKSHDFIQEWYRLTSLTIPAMTLYPEEFLISVASWRTNNRPNGNVWEYFDVKSVIPNKPLKAKKPFWFDKS